MINRQDAMTAMKSGQKNLGNNESAFLGGLGAMAVQLRST